MYAAITEQEARGYLARIGLEPDMFDVPASLELLDQVVLAHLCAVPFDARWVFDNQRPPSLATKDLFAKVVVNRGGGYCFELNGLFDKLLCALGFDARPCLARAVCGRTQPVAIDHRAELVNLEGVLHYVDVGFGGPCCARAVPLVDGLHISDDLHDFVVTRLDETWWRLDRMVDSAGALRCEMEVCTARVYDRDFEALNVAQSLPSSVFCKKELVNLRTKQGSIAIEGLNCKIRSGSGVEARVFDDAAARDAFIASLV